MTAKKLTAEELAVKMEMGNHDWADDAAEMLRQQQAEIEKLKSIVEDTIGQAFYEDDYHKAQAEIEALKEELALQRLSDFTQEAESFDRTASHMAGEYVSYKAELTDAEIRTIQDMCHLKNVGYNNFIMRFARAILRKANEK